ncbi:MAG: hypothetical protein ACYDA0_06660 [Candidatus Dormibacteraceae bacterium]
MRPDRLRGHDDHARQWMSHGEGNILVPAGAPNAAFGTAPASVRAPAASMPAALEVALIAGALAVMALGLALTVRRRRRA